MVHALPHLPEQTGSSALQWTRRGFATSALATAVGCRVSQATTKPIETIDYRDTSDGRLIVMLPGYGDAAADFEKNKFVSTLRSAKIRASAVAVHAHYGYYARRELLPRLEQDVLKPAQANGFDEIWLVGISMGGLGAILSAEYFGERIAGVIVLSPFLGQRSVLRKIRSAGGVSAWTPTPSSKYTVKLWTWIKGYTSGQPRPPMYLAYGAQERGQHFALLAEALPRDHVLGFNGHHNWATWTKAWDALVSRNVFEPA